MQYDHFDITVTDRQGERYPVFTLTEGQERVVGTIGPLPADLRAQLDRLAAQAAQIVPLEVAHAAGAALFRWLFVDRIETHFRLAWDRAVRAGRGLRLRLSLDAPEIAALPWELLHDPVRDHTFATSAATPMLRFYNQGDTFGALAEMEADLPLAMLLVLPAAPDLDLACEQALVREATAPLRGALNLHALESPVTRTRLLEALLATPFDIVHVSTHGGLLSGEPFLQLNAADGGPDWVDAASFARLCANARGLRLVVLNACGSGQVSRVEAFQGLAPQLVRAGVPAVVAMQYVLTDAAAVTFAREFYRQLCGGTLAGQADVAITHARNLLAALYPETLAYAAPVLYTHAAEGILFRLPESDEDAVAAGSASESARLALFMESLQASTSFVDDWSLADPLQLESWRRTLLWAEVAYALHLKDAEPAARQAARHGLALTQSRIAALDEAVSGTKR